MILKTLVLHVVRNLFSRQAKPVEGVEEVLGRRGDRGSCRWILETDNKSKA